ncbi:hypothetical protein [Myceligenerans crystallogenes]
MAPATAAAPAEQIVMATETGETPPVSGGGMDDIDIVAEESPEDGATDDSSESEGTGGGPAKCYDEGNDNAEVPCTDGNGGWWGGTCYLSQVPEAQLPAADDPIWQGNHPDGYIVGCSGYACTGRDPANAPDLAPGQCQTQYTGLIWLPELPGPENVDVEALAEKAVEQMNLQPVTIGIAPEDEPGSVGAVGLPVWAWVRDARPNTFGSIQESATTSNVTVTARASVTTVEWNMGDGTTITCEGPGTPYDESYGVTSSPDCGHVYDEQGNPYTVRATTHWTITWEGAGQTGTLEAERTAETQIIIGEVQVLNR